MSINALEAEYRSASLTTSFSEHSGFIAHLMERNDQEALRFHFNMLLDGGNPRLRDRLRAAFVKRGPSVKEFLLSLLESAGSDETIAECIQILGHLRIDEARPIALTFLSQASTDIRYRAIIVLGWVGRADDLETLGHRFGKEPEPGLRGFIATAMRQIFIRAPEVRDAALLQLYAPIKSETDQDALRLMIASAQTIAQQKFGIRESINNGSVSGDVEKARIRAIQYLGRISPGDEG